jgi:hypothetical protein
MMPADECKSETEFRARMARYDTLLNKAEEMWKKDREKKI